ncbi:MAG TPA: ribonuclease E/G [Acetobacteraceae bacterium]
MTTRLLAACSPGEVRVSVVQDGALLDYAIWRPGRPDGVGDLLRGRVMARVPAMAGVFVALPGTDGFLPDSEGGAGLSDGMAVGVRVTRAAQGGKGPRLTASGVAPVSPGPPVLLSRGPGAVERLAALHPDAPVIADNPALVAQLRPALGARIAVGPVLDDALLGWIEALASPDVPLPGGARASIHPTPALVAIDVDAGSATSDRRAKPAAQMAANLAALPEIARQIRLRNLSGAILVDVAGMSLRRRPALAPAFAAALAGDPLRPRFLGFTVLGLAEIMRPRAHPPLHELLRGPHPAGLAALRELMVAAAAEPSVAFALRCAPDVAAALADDAVALPDLARRTGRPLIVQPDPGLPPLGWTVERTARA